MTKFKSYNKEKNRDTVDKKAFLFGLMSVFLCGMGFSILLFHF